MSPNSGAEGVPLNTRIVVRFDKEVDCATVTTDTFKVKLSGVAVAGTVSCLERAASFTPSALLAASTKYDVELPTVVPGPTIKDLAGNTLAATPPPGGSFTTGTTSATAPWTVVTDPADRAIGVALNKQITVTFSTAMDPTTIHGGTFTLTGPGSSLITGTVRLDLNDATATKATFTPTSNLAPSSTYTAVLVGGAVGIKDMFSNPATTNIVWTFTTTP
jgi:hypothetical protein